MEETAKQGGLKEKTSSAGLRLIAYKTGRTALPIEVASADRQWMDETPYGFANRCLPLRIANQAGWVILNDRKIEATWNGKAGAGDLRIKYYKTRPDEDISKQPLFALSHFGSGILTWKIPYVFRTPPGYDLYVRGVTNCYKDGASALDGIVETEWSAGTFSMNWKLTRRKLTVTFEKGEPICMIFPWPRRDLERFRPEVKHIEQDQELAGKFKRWLAERESFIEKLNSAKTAVWQGDYYAGRFFQGAPFPEHQLKLEVHEFEDGTGNSG
ncbi:MAG TPA: DUF6065 family protein [Candidatus Acidoferrales bacterium]|nr:DUF6065 family protein [Candidatus Acidoferrales bacterium]